MRFIYALLVSGLCLGLMACSSDMMSSGCPEGSVMCGSACIAAGQTCGGCPEGSVICGSACIAAGQTCGVSLTGLAVSGGTLSPAFSPDTTVYTTAISSWLTQVQVTATVAAVGATIEVNGSQVTSGTPSAPIEVGIAGATMLTITVRSPGQPDRGYTVVLMRVPTDYFKASNTDAFDDFGRSVSLSGDTLAIGVGGESSNATGVNGNQANNSAPTSGAVYIFQRTGTTWTQQAYLKASNTGPGDNFGRSVSLSGDTLAVGAHLEASNGTGVNGVQGNNSAKDSGAVYIFQRTGSTWVQQAYLKASNTGAGDLFGASVSLSGDTLAVGAFLEASNATGVNGNQTNNSVINSGAVYIFQRTGSTWAQQAYLKASNTGANDWFGFSVSLSVDTLAVGAQSEDSNATGVDGDQTDNSASQSGAVYIFQRTGSTWIQQAYLKASNTGLNDKFGHGVSLSGDTLAVVAQSEASGATGVNGNQADDSASESGAVYIFQRTGTTWTQQAYLKAFNTGPDDNFGGSISLSGDTLAVGAPSEASNATGVNGNQANNSASTSGAVYIFQRTGTTWTQQTYLKASNTEQFDSFGTSVSLSNGTLAVGAVGEDSPTLGLNGNQADNSAIDSGAVYLFR